MAKRTVKLSVMLEFDLETEEEDEDLVAQIGAAFEKNIRAEWKGFTITLPGAFASDDRRVGVAIGHDVYRSQPPIKRRK